MSEEIVEVEETYLYLDFNGLLDENLLKNGIFFNIIDLNKEEPILQLGNQLFKGALESAVGTYLFLEEDKESPSQNETDEVFLKKPPVNFKVCGQTNKVLKLEKAYLEDTEENEDKYKDNKFDNCPYNELLEKLKLGTLKLEDLPLENDDDLLFKKPAIPKRKAKPTQHHLMLLKDIGKSMALQQVQSKFSQNVRES